MKNALLSVEEANALIAEGRTLILAGDEQLIRQLSPGSWIAGTIPYFMAEEGGLTSTDRIFVNEIPADVATIAIKTYSSQTVSQVYRDIPENGFGIIIIPASCETHLSFAVNAPHYEGFAARPLIGWISGVDLDDLGKVTPKVFSGEHPQPLEDGAVVMQVQLPTSQFADIRIVNIFKQGDGDSITFLEDGFTATDVLINGQKENLADYVLANELDTRLPLVADYSGAMINISFQSVDEAARRVVFYAPVFKGVEYKHAAPVGDYVERFNEQVPAGDGEHILFSCNCILNYLYGGLEGRKTRGFTGPVTFGEVAYQLLNQTMAYLVIGELSS